MDFVFELFSDIYLGKFPFMFSETRHFSEIILNDEIPSLESYNVSKEAKDFVSNLLIKDHTQRLGSSENQIKIKKVSFFNDINWIKLERSELKAPFIPGVVSIIINKECSLRKKFYLIRNLHSIHLILVQS